MGLSITEAARLASVSRQTFSRWEKGAVPSPHRQRTYHKLLAGWDAA